VKPSDQTMKSWVRLDYHFGAMTKIRGCIYYDMRGTRCSIYHIMSETRWSNWHHAWERLITLWH